MKNKYQNLIDCENEVHEKLLFGLTRKESSVPIEEVRKRALSCPFCKVDNLLKTNLSFTYNTHYGQGDKSFDNARIICNVCSGSKGNIAGYGSPTEADERRAWNQWNLRSQFPIRP